MIGWLRRAWQGFGRYIARLDAEDRAHHLRHDTPTPPDADAHYIRALGNITRQEAARDGRRRGEAPSDS